MHSEQGCVEACDVRAPQIRCTALTQLARLATTERDVALLAQRGWLARAATSVGDGDLRVSQCAASLFIACARAGLVVLARALDDAPTLAALCALAGGGATAADGVHNKEGEGAATTTVGFDGSTVAMRVVSLFAEMAAQARRQQSGSVPFSSHGLSHLAFQDVEAYEEGRDIRELEGGERELEGDERELEG
eukprot:6209842-Pleurochrysis_carterae.AAC.1